MQLCTVLEIELHRTVKHTQTHRQTHGVRAGMCVCVCLEIVVTGMMMKVPLQEVEFVLRRNVLAGLPGDCLAWHIVQLGKNFNVVVCRTQ